jgi:chromate transporter
MFLKLIDIFIAFLKVGFLSFGGGYTFVPLIEHQAVEVYKWLSYDEFTKVFGATEAVPGAISIKFATYIGYKEAGLLGVITAITGSCLVPVLTIILLYNVLSIIEKFSLSKSILKGLKSATWGLILGVGLKYFYKTNLEPANIIIGVGAILAVVAFNASPILIIILAGILGCIFYR